jgi:hypothetical protein
MPPRRKTITARDAAPQAIRIANITIGPQREGVNSGGAAARWTNALRSFVSFTTSLAHMSIKSEIHLTRIRLHLAKYFCLLQRQLAGKQCKNGKLTVNKIESGLTAFERRAR